MPTMTPVKLPAVVQELLNIYALGNSSEACTLIRRQTRCSPSEAQKFLAALAADDLDVVKNHSDTLALLLDEPCPSLLERFDAQRPLLLRLVRRGRRLEALSLVRQDGTVGLFQARAFCDALRGHGSHWEQIAEDYAFPGRTFWNRPVPEAPETAESTGMVLAPDVFDPALLAQWLRHGQYRPGVLWVRRMTGAPREDCQALVDRLEELLFEDHPDPWSLLALEKPAMVAALAELPNPEWLMALTAQRGELLDLLAANRNLAAVELVFKSVGCSSVEARRFLRFLNEGKTWDSTLQRFGVGFRWPQPAPLPAVPVERVVAAVRTAVPDPTPAPTPAPVASPQLLGGAPATEHTELFGPCPAENGVDSAVHGLAAMPWNSAKDAQGTASSGTPWNSAKDAAGTASTAMPWNSARDSQSTASSGVPWNSAQDSLATAAGHSAPAPAVTRSLNLDDTDQLVDHLVKFAEACKRKDMGEAQRLFAELETAGFNSRWVTGRFPAVKPLLPPEPWNDNLPALGKAAETVHGILQGSVDPIKLAREHAAKALQAANLDKIVSALETAWKTKNKADLEMAVGLVREHPDLEQEINQRVPWLTDLLDMDHDGTSDVLEIASHPGQYFTDLIKSKHPELLTRLGDARLQKIQEALPELLDALKERNMRGVMKTMTRLRLGPSDVKSLLAVLKALMDRR